MKKILIIGKKSFLGSNLTIYLSKYYNVDNFSFNKALKKKSNFFSQYSYIINTTIHPNYVKKNINLFLILIRNLLINLIMEL